MPAKSPTKKKPPTSPFATPFGDACRNDGIGRDRGYALIRAGEWESYVDGNIRMVTVVSINARRQRMIAETGGATFKPAPLRGQRKALPDGEEAVR
jgi:hypothetical protein